MDQIRHPFWGRLRMRRCGLTMIAAATLALAGHDQATAATATVAALAAPSPVSLFDGRAVWSSYDPGSRRYRLMTAEAGVAAPVSIRGRGAAFDVDLGPGPGGHVVAAYSRCRREASTAVSSAGCDLYSFDFSTGRERKLTGASTRSASETNPSIWRDTVAFQRRYERRGGRRSGYDLSRLTYIYSRALSGGRSDRHTGGHRGLKGGQASSIDLYGDNLSFAWSTDQRIQRELIGPVTVTNYDIRLDDIATGRHTTVRGAVTGGDRFAPAEVDQVLAPSGASGRITYLKIGNFTPDARNARIERYRIGGDNQITASRLPLDEESFSPTSLGFDNGLAVYSTDRDGSCGPAPGTQQSYCQVRVDDGLPFMPTF